MPALLYVPLMMVGYRLRGPVELGLISISMLMAGVPAWSAMIAAVGAPARRKLIYSTGLLACLLAFDAVAFLTGWQHLFASALAAPRVNHLMAVSAYKLAYISIPIITLILFAGKRPSVFWESKRNT